MSQKVKVVLVKNQACLADECSVAKSFMMRLKGLLGTKVLKPGRGLFLTPCNDIHMWFMSIPIDVVFVRKNKQGNPSSYIVSSIRENLKPWKFLPCRDGNASATLELPVGTIQRSGVSPGDELCIN